MKSGEKEAKLKKIRPIEAKKRGEENENEGIAPRQGGHTGRRKRK